MAAKPVITFTMNPAVDLFGETQEIFDDSKSRCIQTALIPGGGGINVARNMRRMGSDTIAVFPAGGPNGNYLAQLLDDDGQRYQAIPTAAHTRQNFAITDTSREVMHHFVFPGPALSAAELSACREALVANCQDMLVLSGSLPENIDPAFYAEITDAVKQNGCKVLLDTSGKALSETLFRGAYLAKLNRKEFSSLGFDEHAPVATLKEQMIDMVERGAVDVLIVTLNRGGALLVSKEPVSKKAVTNEPVTKEPVSNGANSTGVNAYYFSAPKTKIISHVGAGDAFMSALAHQLNQGASLKNAFRYGVAAAYVTVQCTGNQLDDLNWLERAVKDVVEEPI